jgi:WD40 repeat protein/DNA-binding SARP family transcriptional activator
MLEYHALGPLTVSDGANGERPIGGQRQRRLLAMLLIHRNSVVSVDRIAEAVFAGEPTAAAGTTLRSYVARLRRVVDHNGDAAAVDGAGRSNLVTQAPGYMLQVADDSFDVGRFESLLAAGRAALGRDDAVAAASSLRAALGVWHGEPYAEFADEDWARAEAQRLHELRLVAHEVLADAELACGRAAETVSLLEQLVDEHPLRDGFRERLMLALYRAGRQPDALRAYQQHREVLAEELGLDPSPALVDLEHRILEHDPALLLDEPAGQPLRGYRLGERLGVGRQGTVYAARLPGVDRDLAIRVYRPEVADGPELVRTFEADAQRVAAVRHDAIAPIYDYWREPGAAYLVMQRMSGGTLRDRLRRGPLSPQELSAVVTRIGGALEAAAAGGVAHGRLDPACVLFDERGLPHLTDFTIGSVAGSGSDGHDLAALVAACFTGAAGADAPATLPEALRELLAADRPPVATVVATLVGTVTGTAAPTERPANPYKGLRAFDEPDAADFFGRDRIVESIVERLGVDDVRGRLVVVVGGSGCGKSSIVRAGLLPRLRAGVVPGSDAWFATTILPGGAPYKELAEGLRRVAVAREGDGGSELVESLSADEGGIDRTLRLLLPEGGQLLLVIDQLEELFTLAPEQEQRAFLDALLHAVSSEGSRLRVVATLRADFYDRPLQLHRFGTALSDATVTVPAMSAAELEAAVVGPAERSGITVEPALAVELVAAVVDEPAALPSLQLTLYELAERAPSRALTRADYEALGSVDVAIAARAEELYRSLDDDARTAVRRMFERLVVVTTDREPTRRPARRSEIAALGPDASTDEAVETWAQARLLTVDRHPETREPTVEVAHEALLRDWPRLRGWIEEDRESIVALGHLREAAASWVDLSRDDGALYRGARLDHVLDVMDDRVATLPVLEHEFLDASRAARDEERRADAERVHRQARANRRLRMLVAGIALGLVISLVLGFVAVDQRDRAQRERRVAGARELAAASVANLESDPELSVLLALEAMGRTQAGDGSALYEAQEALHRAVTASRVVLTVPDVGGWVDWSSDGSMFVSEGPEDSGMIDIRDARTGESIRSWHGHDLDVNMVMFSRDGSMLATAGDDGALRVWDPTTGDEVRSFEIPDALVFGPSFSPDGSRVAAVTSDGLVRVFDMRTGSTVAEHELQIPAFSVDWSPDGRRLAIGSAALPVAVVIDAESGAEVFRLEFRLAGHTWPVMDARWSPDGRWIATASQDGTAGIWDAQTGELRFELSGHAGQVNTVDWSPDSRRLVSGSQDGTARVWEISDLGAVEQLRLSTLATRPGVAGVAFSPDGRQVMAGMFGTKAVQVWDVTVGGSAEWANVRTVGNIFGDAAFTRDGEALVASGPGRSAKVWNTATWRPSGRLGPTSAPVSAVGVSADGRWVATGNFDTATDVWDRATGKRAFSIDGPTWGVAWSPTDDKLAHVSSFALTIVDASDRKRVTLEGDIDASFTSVAFDSTGRYLVTSQLWAGRADFSIPEVRIWDWQTGKVVRTIDALADKAVFSPDSDLIAATNIEQGRIEIYDARSGDQIRTLRGHTGAILDLDFAPDGTTVATSSSDGTVRIWDTASGASRLVLRGHESAVGALAFSPDGATLASVAADGVARVWALDPDDLVEIAQQKVTRTLTDDECRQYLHVESCSAA